MRLEAAMGRRKQAGDHFEEVMQVVPPGVQLPNDRILHASRAYSAAQEEVTAALRALNQFLGITPVRSDHDGGTSQP